MNEAVSALVWVDVLAILIIGVSSVYGFFRGFFVTLLSLIGLVVSLIFFKKLGDALLSLIAGWGDSLLAMLVIYPVAFFLIMSAFIMAGKLIKSILKKLDLGTIDTLGGLFFGVLRGGAVMACLILVFSATPIVSSEGWEKSHYLGVGGRTIYYALQLPALKPYENWMTFDEQWRPTLDTRHILARLKGDQATEPPPATTDVPAPPDTPPAEAVATEELPVTTPEQVIEILSQQLPSLTVDGLGINKITTDNINEILEQGEGGRRPTLQDEPSEPPKEQQ